MSRIQTPDTASSFEKSAKPLLLALKPARSWRVFIIGFHLLALFAVLLTRLPWFATVPLSLFALISLVYHLYQSSRTVELIWRTGNRWFIDHSTQAAELFAIDFMSRWLVILTLQQSTPPRGLLKLSTRRQKFIIPFDALDQKSFHLLRVRLRIEGYEILNPTDDVIK